MKYATTNTIKVNSPASKVMITYGGGMGGASETFIVEKIEDKELISSNSAFIKVRLFPEGTEKVLNKKFIVKCETGNVYGIKRSDFRNIGNVISYYFFDEGKTVVMVDEFDETIPKFDFSLNKFYITIKDE